MAVKTFWTKTVQFFNNSNNLTWLVRIATIILLLKLSFFSTTKTITIYPDEAQNKLRDSLTIIRYQINQLMLQDSTLQYKYDESTTHMRNLPDDSIQRIITKYRASHHATRN